MKKILSFNQIYLKSLHKYLAVLFLLFIVFPSSGQLLENKPLKNKHLKWYLSDDKTTWIAIHSFAQLWLRVNENNPGSLVSEKPQNTTFDISIRRFRLGIKAQLTEKLYVVTQLGTNNLNYLSPRGKSIDLLDLYIQYKFSQYLSIGGGKSPWDGLSRYSSPSTSKLLGYDLNFISQPTLDSTDDLIRKLSVYIKGKIGSVDYRFIFAKPMSVQNSKAFNSEPQESIAQFTDNRSSMQYSGYLKYEFWEAESNHSYAHVGTYLGTKKVLNLGIGFTLQPNALWSLDQDNEHYHNMNLFAADIFLDLPINQDKKTALTAYFGYFNFDFGPNYIRLLGVNNPIGELDPEQSSFNGKGNAFPISGTGTSTFTQLGYLFTPMGKKQKGGQLQPYFSAQYSKFDRFQEVMFYYDLGVNWYFNGHHSKLVLNAESRPIFNDHGDGLQTNDRKWMFVLGYQFRID